MGGRGSVTMYRTSKLPMVWLETDFLDLTRLSRVVTFFSTFILSNLSLPRSFFQALISDLDFLMISLVSLSWFILVSFSSLFSLLTTHLEFCKHFLRSWISLLCSCKEASRISDCFCNCVFSSYKLTISDFFFSILFSDHYFSHLYFLAWYEVCFPSP